MILCHVCRTILKGRPAQTQRPAASQSFWTIDCSYFHPTVFIPTTIASSYRILMEKLRSLRTAAIQHRDFLQLLLWDPVWGRGCQRTTGFDLWGLCYNFDLIVCTLHPKKMILERIGSSNLEAMTLRLACKSLCMCFDEYNFPPSGWMPGPCDGLGPCFRYMRSQCFFLASFDACM